MDKLPQETIDHIVKFLPKQTCVGRKDGLASIAPVSRQWQQAVERRTFSTLKLWPEHVEEFARFYDETIRGTTRLSALKRLRYFIQNRPQSWDDRNKCSSIDKKWNACSSSERNAELEFNTKIVLSRLERLYDIVGGRSVRPSIDLEIHVPTRTTYYLVAPEAVPKSQAIKRLRCSGGACSPALFISIASGLPALQGFALHVHDLYPSINPVERRKKRYDLAKQLLSLASSCSTLRDFELTCLSTNIWDELTDPPSILLPCSDTDHLSLSIQELVRACKTKSLTLDDIPFTLQLFRSHQKLNDTTPWWHTLTHIDIAFSSMAADGGWFLDGHPEMRIALDTEEERYDLGPRRRKVHEMFARQEALARDFDFEEDLRPQYEVGIWEQVIPDCNDETPFLFRILPSQKGNALLLDMARAAAQMPGLKSFRGGCNMELCPGKRRFEFQYLAPYERCPELYDASGFTFDPPLEEYSEDALHINRHRLYWRVARSWRMSEELELCWQQVMGHAGIIEYYEWSMSLDDYDPLWRDNSTDE